MGGVDKKSLVLLAYTKKEAREKLRWEKQGEFEYNHQMYDIVETETRGDSVLYQCLWDEEETSVDKKIKGLVAKAWGHDPQNKESQQQLFSFFKSLYLPLYFVWRPDDQSHELEYNQDNLIRYSSVFYEPPVPPPRSS
ncbi:MAG: hypothetical protein M0P58_00455 [Bacteroidales bacterium]|nr:hypothetical protein [Bacteroidales bacterium]